jgi:hypothetical protein
MRDHVKDHVGDMQFAKLLKKLFDAQIVGKGSGWPHGAEQPGCCTMTSCEQHFLHVQVQVVGTRLAALRQTPAPFVAVQCEEVICTPSWRSEHRKSIGDRWQVTGSQQALQLQVLH